MRMALVDSPNSASSPRRYALVLLFRKNLSSSFMRVLEVIKLSNILLVKIVVSE